MSVMYTPPTISVLMSVYNERLAWIEESINSILNQNFSDFEFIIINDNPDKKDLEEFLYNKQQKDPRIIIHANSENVGLAKSLNTGIKMCRGKYIARMDADDISLPGRLKKQFDFLEQHPDIGVCGTFAQKIDENGCKHEVVKLFQSSKDLKESVCFFVPFIHPTVMIRREILLNNPYDEHCRIAQDYNLWGRLSSITRFANIPEVLLRYRVHSNQAPQKAGMKRSAESRAYSDSMFADILSLTPETKKTFILLRGGESVDDSEIDTLYEFIIKNSESKGVSKHALNSYIRVKSHRHKLNLLQYKVAWKNPMLTASIIIMELKKLFCREHQL